MMSSNNNLHDRDFNLWLNAQAIALREKNITAMDFSNLIDEIEDMGASQKRALESYTQRLIEHILKLKYWHKEQERCQRGWRSEVKNFRKQIKRILKRNPSLSNHLEQVYPELFQDAVEVMEELFSIPNQEHFDVDWLLSDDYFGEI